MVNRNVNKNMVWLMVLGVLLLILGTSVDWQTASIILNDVGYVALGIVIWKIIRE